MLKLDHAKGEHIQKTIIHVDIDKAPEYQALSYTWGNPTPVYDMLIDGKTFEIRHNLHCLFETHFRLSNSVVKEEYLWIDQICIDQSSSDEKNHQVRLMGQIYNEASMTIVWLGPCAEEDDEGIKWLFGFILLCSSGITLKGKTNDGLHLECDESMLPASLTGHLQRLLTVPYWKRQWVIQELLLGRNAMLTYGKHALELKHFVTQVNLCHLFTSLGLHLLNIISYVRGSRWERRPLCGHQIVDVLGLKTECVDMKDKIFSLHSILPANIRVEVDYTKSVDQIFLEFSLNLWRYRRRFRLSPYSCIVNAACSMGLLVQEHRGVMLQKLLESDALLMPRGGKLGTERAFVAVIKLFECFSTLGLLDGNREQVVRLGDDSFECKYADVLQPPKSFKTPFGLSSLAQIERRYGSQLRPAKDGYESPVSGGYYYYSYYSYTTSEANEKLRTFDDPGMDDVHPDLEEYAPDDEGDYGFVDDRDPLEDWQWLWNPQRQGT